MTLLATLMENVWTSTGDSTVGVTVAISEMEWRIAQVPYNIIVYLSIATTIE